MEIYGISPFLVDLVGKSSINGRHAEGPCFRRPVQGAHGSTVKAKRRNVPRQRCQRAARRASVKGPQAKNVSKMVKYPLDPFGKLT